MEQPVVKLGEITGVLESAPIRSNRVEERYYNLDLTTTVLHMKTKLMFSQCTALCLRKFF